MSKSESLHDISITRICDTLSYGFPQADREIKVQQKFSRDISPDIIDNESSLSALGKKDKFSFDAVKFHQNQVDFKDQT